MALRNVNEVIEKKGERAPLQEKKTRDEKKWIQAKITEEKKIKENTKHRKR
jgi:hypothetical protein